MIFSSQFVRFIAVGASAALMNWLARIVFNYFVPFVWAVPAAFFVGLGVAFALNRQFVFPQSNLPLGHQAAYFLAVNVLMLPVVWGGSMLLVVWVLPAFGWKYFVAEVGHAVALALPTAFSFVLHKTITFAQKAQD